MMVKYYCDACGIEVKKPGVSENKIVIYVNFENKYYGLTPTSVYEYHAQRVVCSNCKDRFIAQTRTFFKDELNRK
jgi:DNA-directed RNA polymerase subunit RPC12/RpoP